MNSLILNTEYFFFIIPNIFSVYIKKLKIVNYISFLESKTIACVPIRP